MKKMTGRKIPATYQRAIMYLLYNKESQRGNKKLKKQARREERRYLKMELLKIL